MFFKYITQDIWNEEIEKFKNYCSINNSSFNKGIINIYSSFDDFETLIHIENELVWIINKLKKFKYSNDITIIQYDIDYSCRLGFIDIILSPKINQETLTLFLQYIKNTLF